MREPGGVIDILGILFVFLGTVGLIVQLDSFRTYRRLRALERSGIEGEAVIADCVPARGLLMRLRFQVRMPDEAGPAVGFEQVMLDPPGSLGDVVPVIYDPERPARAKVGFRRDIDYRGERLAVFLFGYGGLTLFVAGSVMITLCRPFV